MTWTLVKRRSRLAVFAQTSGSSSIPRSSFPGYLLIASIALALAQGDLDSVGVAIVGVAALVVFVGIVVIVKCALLSEAALHNPTQARRP